MKQYIIYFIFSITFFSCNADKKKSKKIIEVASVQIDTIKANKTSKLSSEKHSVYYVVANKLSFRDAPSLESNKISVLMYLEPMYLIKNYTDKQETIYDEGKTILGNWMYVQLLNGRKGYVFNGFLKKADNLGTLPRKGIMEEEMLINGKLRIKTTKEEFLKTLGKPDTIKSFKVVDDDELIGKMTNYQKEGVYYTIENVAEYFGTELGDLMWFDNPRTKIYYTKGVKYEELDGKMIFLSVDFDTNQNFIDYNSFKIEGTTTDEIISTIFPITAKKSKWCDTELSKDCVFEFGSIRNNKYENEVSWQLHTIDKTVSSFNFYFYD